MSSVRSRPWLRCLALLAVIAVPARAQAPASPPTPTPAADPFAPLALYDGEWAIRAEHPWSGAAPGAVDRLIDRCHRFRRYFACEQTVNGTPASLIVYTAGAAPDRLHTRSLAPDGLAGGRGELTLVGPHWTYFDKPPSGLKGPWSRTENFVDDPDHLRFEEYESTDEGQTWQRTNAGTETRVGAGGG